MNPSIVAYDIEIVKIIKQLHKSRREIWKLQKEGKMPEHTKRQHMISRRDQKMFQRKRGLQHMISTRDKLLTECQPRNLKWEEFIKDCIKATNTSDIHSDEWSTEDEELANKERSKNTRSG
ncbi:hypothetical protein GLOIN_2v1772065 [Rhizophagus irregularis DAOM 181602=DAOM 197198]|nr:hypothetical protein GLOIN_2v1772065 [Rhizophagus irregularis DAOM 181602=DAOM 197198]